MTAHRPKRLVVAAVVGTRPEAIKMAPVIKALQSANWCECIVVATAQHRQMLDQVLDLFGIKVDIDLDVMRERQSLPALTARLFESLDAAFQKQKLDLVLAQGDTTTVMVAAMIAFYHRIPFGHVEAGLRTGDLNNPFPEEMNRVVASRLAALHFTPTKKAADALLREGVREADIIVTGNTVIDALLEVAKRAPDLPMTLPAGQRLILLTAHRRENFGAPNERIFSAINRLIKRHPDIEVIYPVHSNPNVKRIAHERLGSTPRVHLRDPLDYNQLVAVMKASVLILTDSGGIQEEAPALGKPVLVLREQTERPEAVEAGVAKLVGTDEDTIVDETTRLLEDETAYRAMAQAISPYGDGKAAGRIVTRIWERYGRDGDQS
ncbi:UDP-N-acetylglucosamine 2-epimerase (non-hydrolyzing) [Hyphomicrobium methylovorum]|uniref:non-hydrolyzing UDP-N-acetylglucosamine 2-epimerase n=1 Tax=Hyphomicrobium methylovorum TaxID=84 RepID=UPI0015E65184|nr:UDP-N-acetylglucosamine 2-epimerase (non-hydrolyzing) [Hyphomicrobium methylovorum]MBA2125580.1 UDP-N-acetylglucosamine 2-epimerase (non-hydrolyzing) [Hyphomicrobium methylovorum]